MDIPPYIPFPTGICTEEGRSGRKEKKVKDFAGLDALDHVVRRVKLTG